MTRDEAEHLWALVRRLQRAPEPLDDVEAERALTVLKASRGDAAMLLLQRVMVLERALEHLKTASSSVAAAGPAGAGSVPAMAGPDPAPAPAAPLQTSPFLRQAGTIAAGVATGVVVGGLVGDALDGLFGDDAFDGL
jgi:hypothetical protein